MCRMLTIKNIVAIFVFGLICHTVLTWLLIFEHEAIVQLGQSSWLKNQSHSVEQLLLDQPGTSSSNESSNSHKKSAGFRPFQFTDITNDLAVFYNVYIPKPEPGNENRTSHAADVFIMQMRQIGISHSNREFDEPLKVFYNTMGQDEVIEDQEICERHEVDCIHMNHYEQGDEDITLQNLYDYCGQFPTHRVIYVHAKGTYHSSHANNENRITMTFSVLTKCSETIKQHGDEPPLCNACGGMFMPVWGPFMSGNMWAARCDLVNELVPPLEFRSRMIALNKAREATQNNLQTALITNVGDYCLGLGRYSNEHWYVRRLCLLEVAIFYGRTLLTLILLFRLASILQGCKSSKARTLRRERCEARDTKSTTQ